MGLQEKEKDTKGKIEAIAFAYCQQTQVNAWTSRNAKTPWHEIENKSISTSCNILSFMFYLCLYNIIGLHLYKGTSLPGIQSI